MEDWFPGKVSPRQSVDLFAVTGEEVEEDEGGKVFPRRTWQRRLTNVGPPGWSMLLWNHTADSRQWTTHSANRPCVLHNTKEEEGSRLLLMNWGLSRVTGGAEARSLAVSLSCQAEEKGLNTLCETAAKEKLCTETATKPTDWASQLEKRYYYYSILQLF